MTRSNWILGIVAAVVLLAALGVFLRPKNALIVSDQKIRDIVLVKKATLHRSGFVTVFLATPYNKVSTNMIAKSTLLPAGTYTNLGLAILQAPGADRTTLYFAVLLEDTDNNGAVTSGDRIAKDWIGRELIPSFHVF